MNKQIVYILSTNYAGSHFLALQLGSHSRCASIGELHHFRRKKTDHKACYQCPTDDECPVFAGVREKPVRSFYPTIFQNLLAYDGAITTVIDNSKKVRWARRFVDMPGYTKKYIHLIRDPRALVRRWMITFNEKEKRKMRLKTARRCWRHTWDILTGDEANVYIWEWLYENQQITKFIQSNKLDAKIVTYRDLALEPDRILSDLMAWLGCDYEPNQKNYSDFMHHGSGKRALSHVDKSMDEKADQKWKAFLDVQTQQRIYSHPIVNRYLKDMGVLYDLDLGLLKES